MHMTNLNDKQIRRRVVYLDNDKTKNGSAHQIAQYIHYFAIGGLPFGTLLSSVVTSYMLGTL